MPRWINLDLYLLEVHCIKIDFTGFNLFSNLGNTKIGKNSTVWNNEAKSIPLLAMFCRINPNFWNVPCSTGHTWHYLSNNSVGIITIDVFHVNRIQSTLFRNLMLKTWLQNTIELYCLSNSTGISSNITDIWLWLTSD